MNAYDIDWTQAPEGYDYYIVDTHGEHESRFHYLETDHGSLTDIFGEIYVDENGQNWVGEPNRLEIYTRPEQGDKPLRLRCVSSDASDNSFSVGTVYEVVEDNTTEGGGHYVLIGDDNMTWAITKDALEFAGDPDVGKFEAAYVGDSVNISEEIPQGPAKTEPEFGDIVHVQGKPYVFVRVDEDGDYYVVSGDGDECYLDINDIDEYAHEDSTTQLRNLILTDIKEFCNNSLEDHMTSVVNFNIPELIDFIMMYKDNWDF